MHEETQTTTGMRRWRLSIFRSNTLFAQIVSRLLVVVVGFAFLDFAIVLALYSSDENSLSQDVIDIQAEAISGDVLENLSDTAKADDLLRRVLTSDGPTRSARIFDRNGKELARHNIDGMPLPIAPISTKLVNWSMREATKDGVRVTGIKQVTSRGRSYWIAVAVEGDNWSIYGPSLVREVLQHVALPLVPLTLLLLAFSIAAVRASLRPLQMTADQVDQLGPLDVSRRLIVPDKPIEVGALALGVNKALDRMEKAIIRLREFSADVAHELRTPLMVMMLTIDRLPESPEKPALQKDARDMSKLVTQLLDFAHADALEVSPTMTAHLPSIAKDVVAQLTPIAVDDGKEIRFCDHGCSIINGHADAIGRALRNVVENALRYAPAHTLIEVSAGPGATLSVSDKGPGFPGSDPSLLLERFRRGGKPASGADGAGLGLNIVQSIMHAHRGSVRIENAPDGGAIVTLDFRTAEATANA